jgi:hypothetical protein
MKLVMRKHALDQIADRKLDRAWVERVALRPEWTQPDDKPGVMRHYGAIPEFGYRVLRVVVVDRGLERHVLTAHFDRGASRGGS